MTEAPEAIGQVEAQMNKDIGDLAASPIKDEQGDSRDTASPDGGHIEGHARGKPVKPERLASGETKKGEADGKAAEKPAAPGGGADQADRKLPEVVESEQTVNESSSDEDDLDDEEDESSDYTDETETDDSDEEEGSQED